MMTNYIRTESGGSYHAPRPSSARGTRDAKAIALEDAHSTGTTLIPVDRRTPSGPSRKAIELGEDIDERAIPDLRQERTRGESLRRSHHYYRPT